jgi:YD repeat-containing protein
LTSVSTNTRQSAFTYTADGFLESVTDSEDHTTSYEYDPIGRMTGINRPDGNFVDFSYDANGNMTVLINPAGTEHGFGYNLVNNNSSYLTPLSGSYSYIYDKDRRLIQTNFPSGKNFINDYTDPLNPIDKSRLWQIRTSEGNIDFTYLCGTKIKSITKGTESIAYGYDGKLIISETLAGTLNQSLNYAYNDDFDVSAFSYGPLIQRLRRSGRADCQCGQLQCGLMESYARQQRPHHPKNRNHRRHYGRIQLHLRFHGAAADGHQRRCSGRRISL